MFHSSLSFDDDEGRQKDWGLKVGPESVEIIIAGSVMVVVKQVKCGLRAVSNSWLSLCFILFGSVFNCDLCGEELRHEMQMFEMNWVRNKIKMVGY